MFDVAVIGGGIVGMATAHALLDKHPNARLVVLDKEATWGAHQTGHNSGVIHSGIYYAPGSLKAAFARAGSRSLVAFCRAHDLPFEVCGKLIVATEDWELPLLDNLHRRGIDNGLDVVKLDSAEVREIEPHVRCLAAIRIPTAGITDYRAVCNKLAELVAARGGELRANSEVLRIVSSGDEHVLETSGGPVSARFLVSCAGLQSDRLARLGGVDPGARIVPFRGEYYELKPDRRHLVKHLVYPVPNPAFPFLGVHFTRMIDGNVHAGPNAVLALKREGYRKRDISLRDVREVLAFGGFWRLAARHARDGAAEVVRSVNKQAFVKSLQKLIPEVTAKDVIPSHAGVRAQALTTKGLLVDDFLFAEGQRALYVCNAPSPAATAALEIGNAISAKVEVEASKQVAVGA